MELWCERRQRRCPTNFSLSMLSGYSSWGDKLKFVGPKAPSLLRFAGGLQNPTVPHQTPSSGPVVFVAEQVDPARS